MVGRPPVSHQAAPTPVRGREPDPSQALPAGWPLGAPPREAAQVAMNESLLELVGF